MNRAMKTGALVALMLALSALVWAADPPAYQGRRMLSRLVGDDCVLFTTLPSPKATLEALKGLAPYRLSQDPEVQAFWKSGQEWLDKRMAEAFKTTSAKALASAAKCMEVFDRQASLAVFRLDEQVPEFLALLESSRAANAAETWLDEMMKEEVLERYTGAKPQAVMVNGVKWYEIEAKPYMAVCARGAFLVIGNSKERVSSLLAALDRPPDRSLETADSFVRARKAVGGDGAHFFLFLDTAKAWEQALKDHPADARLRENARLLGFDFVAASLRTQGNRALSRIYVQPSPGQAETILKYVSRRPNPLETLELVPDGATLFASTSLKVPAVVADVSGGEEFTRSLFLLPGEQEAAKKPQVEEALKAFGAALGDEVAGFVQMPLGGGVFPDAAALVRTADPAALEENLRALLKLGGVTREPTPFLGTRLYTLAGPERRSPFTPALALVGRNLVISYRAQPVKSLIRFHRQPEALLRDKESFKQALADNPVDRVAFVYLDMKGLLLWFYNTLAPLLSVVEREGGRVEPTFDMALLPTAKTLAQYFGSVTICAHWEGDGLVLLTTSEGFDPLSLAVHAQVFGPYVLPFWFLADRL